MSVAESVVAEFQRIVEPDGGALELVSVEGDTVHVRYRRGTNEECGDACVLGAPDLEALMSEALQRRNPRLSLRIEMA